MGGGGGGGGGGGEGKGGEGRRGREWGVGGRGGEGRGGREWGGRGGEGRGGEGGEGRGGEGGKGRERRGEGEGRGGGGEERRRVYPHFSVGGFLQQCGVAEVVGLHDGGVQRGEVQRCYGKIIVPTEGGQKHLAAQTAYCRRCTCMVASHTLSSLHAPYSNRYNIYSVSRSHGDINIAH